MRRQEAVGKILHPARRIVPMIQQQKTGKILVFAAEPIGDPGTDGRVALKLGPGVHVHGRRPVIVVVDFDSMDKGDVIDALAELGQQG